jgi:hypothetical protein
MAQDRELRELARGASFTASDEEVDAAIVEAADEFDETEEEVRNNVAYIMDSTFEEEGVSTSFNEMVSGAALEDDIGSTGDPRLEALEMYKLRQKL